MTVLSRDAIAQALALCEDETASNLVRGNALEDLANVLFTSIPGIEFTARNGIDAFAAQEIDLVCWNAGHPDGLANFPTTFLVECKNWGSRVGSMEVAWFDAKLRLKGCSFGILLALNCITGKQHSLTAAHSIVALARKEQRDLVVITKADLLSLNDSSDLVQLIKRKIVQILVSRPF